MPVVDIVQIVFLGVSILVFAARVCQLRFMHGTSVVAIGRAKRGYPRLAEWLFPWLALVWIWEVIAYSRNLKIHLPPPAIHARLLQSGVVQWLGVILLACALVLFGTALRAMGRSWRVGIDSQSPGHLVTEGVFRYTRNPIFVAIDLYAVGTFLINGTPFFLIFAGIAFAMIHYQILHEEHFLRSHYGEAYDQYSGCVGRYWTRLM